VSGEDIDITLHRPAAFDVIIHAEAEANHDYSKLSIKNTLIVESNEDWLTVTIPELRTWGIVVISSKTKP